MWEPCLSRMFSANSRIQVPRKCFHGTPVRFSLIFSSCEDASGSICSCLQVYRPHRIRPDGPVSSWLFSAPAKIPRIVG